jgi:hypothetical protein
MTRSIFLSPPPHPQGSQHFCASATEKTCKCLCGKQVLEPTAIAQLEVIPGISMDAEGLAEI